MPRNITIKFEDGSSHIYENAPDDATPEQVYARAQKDFAAKKVVHLDGGKSQQRAEIPGGGLAADRNVGKKELVKQEDFLKGVGEAALSTGTGMIAGVAGPVLAGVDRLLNGGDWEKKTVSAMEAMTYAPRTEKGQEYASNVSKVFNELIPIAGVAGSIPSYRVPRAPRIPKVEPVDPVLANLDKLETPTPKPVADPGARAMESIVENQLTGWQEPLPPARGTGIDTVVSQLEQQRMAEVQRILEERQRQMEFEVARQATLARNAAERARQEAAPTNLEGWTEQQRMAANERLPGDNTPVDFTPTSVPTGLADTPYRYEGGIDYTAPRDAAALPIEVADTLRTGDRSVDPFQRYSPQQQARRILEEGETPPIIKTRRGGKQSGAIDLKSLEDGFEKFKTLPNGFKLWAFSEGDGQLNVIAMDKDGHYAGGVRMAPENYRNPSPDDFMSSLSTDSFQKGLATEMYKFVAEMGNDITPSKTQSLAGKRMWESFERRGISQNKMIKGQRGAVDVKSIAEEARKIGDKIASIGSKAVALATPKERVIARAINDNSLIPKGDTPEAIIAKAMQEPDGPALFENTQSGLTQAAAKANSSLMFGVARWLNYGEKVGGKYFRENVKPVEEKLSNLTPAELSTNMKVMIQEMNRRKQYTPDELRSAGMSEKQLQAYEALRSEFDNVYRVTNEARALQGKPPISKQGAYFASMWNGNYHMPVYDNKGKIIWYVKTETAREAKAAAKWIAANVPDVNPKSLKYEYRPQNTANRPPRDVISIYEDMLEVFKDTPMAQEIKALMENVQEEAGFTSRQHQVHFENKANVRGFAGDRPWLSDKENALMAAKAQVQYLKDAYRWAPLQEAMHNIKQVLSNEDLVTSQPNNVAMARAYTANTMGYTKNMFQGFENYVSRLSGVSPANYAKAVGSLKTLTYLTQLGISTGYMIATPLQALILGPAQHMKLTNQGFKYNFLNSAANAMSDALMMLGVHQMDSMLGKDYRSKLSPLGQDALRYMEDNGIIDVSLFDEYAALGEHKGVDFLKSTIGSTIQFPEKMARSMTFMSFVHHLNDSGMPKAEIFRKAEELTDNTLTKFSKTARPLIADKTGLVGELAYTYKSPVFNYYNNLIEFANDYKRTGNFMPLLTAGLIMPSILGGVMGIPMVAELEDAMTLFKEGVAKFAPKHYDKVKDLSIKEAAMRNLPDAAMYGVVSEATGAQMASRFSTKTLDINKPMEDMFPAFGQAGNLVSGAASVLTNPNETSFAQAAYQNTPPAVKGVIETTADTFKAGQQGDKTLYFNPNKLKERDVAIDRTAKDELYRRLGLTSVLEARKKDARYLANTETKRQMDVQKAMVTGAIDAVVRADPEAVGEYISKYVSNGGDPKQLMTQLNREIENSKLTPEQRQVMRAKTLQQVEAIQRRMAMEK